MIRVDRVALLTLLGVVALAALLRIPGLDARGPFDADQGHDMATLVAFVRDGVVPLLGPKTSVGDFHHGAFYYYLLAPASGLSNGDPVAVTFALALLGIGAVALTWWLGRAMAGPLAGLIAGVLLAASPAGIEQSTFIWNPNPIAFFAVLSLAAAWRARTGGRGAWWAVALGAAGVVVQLHVLGVVFLIAMIALGVLELRRDRGLAGPILGGLGLVALLFVPLAVHELQHDFSETRGVLAYLQGGDPGPAGGPVAALTFTLLRVVGWPLVGLVTDVPMLAALVLAVLVGLVGWRLVTARGLEATAMRWLVGIAVWSTVALALVAPSLQRVVAGLPNDHYHAFIDPIVVILIALPMAALLERAWARWQGARRPAAIVGVAAVGALLVTLVGLEIARRPQTDANGGWVAARAAGARIVEAAGSHPITMIGLPDFKLDDGVRFPVAAAGGRLTGDLSTNSPALVIACDRWFEGAIGAPCGGPAEDAWLAAESSSPDGASLRLVDRFNASPRTSISVYWPGDAP